MVNVFNDKRVLITGHTGFKGSWLSLLLLELGADVSGYSLDFPSEPNLFTEADLQSRLHHFQGDIRDSNHLAKVFQETKPEYVFHLAAQPLVRFSYDNPKETFDTNVGGTVNVLECVRLNSGVRVFLHVTTDKCYENAESNEGYRETDRLGGHDPYSASKAASELVTYAYRASFLTSIGVATARAGNVIGGGDWGKDRILPDSIRALAQQEPIPVRNPQSVRPWQHVLDCLSGYLCLAAQLTLDPKTFSGAWNFGPDRVKDLTVREVVEKVLKLWGDPTTCSTTSGRLNPLGRRPTNRWWGEGSWQAVTDPQDNKKETRCLKLNCEKALQQLQWRPLWDEEEAIAETVNWYRQFYQKRSSAYDLSLSQLRQYKQAAGQQNILWAKS